MKSTFNRLGEYIEEIDFRNNYGNVSNLLGVSITKEFIFSVANVIGTDLNNYKIIKKGQFACSLMQVSRDGGIAVSLYKEDEPAIMSPAYHLFKVVNYELLPEYLEMIMISSEFDRAAVFYAVGGVRGTLTWEEFCNMRIPIPSIENQHKIVNDYKVITDRIELLRKINENLEKQAYTIYENYVNVSTEYCKIENIGKFLRGKNITSDEMIQGKYDVVSAGLNPSGCHNEFNVIGPSITISGSGVNAGYFSIHSDNIWAADCSYCNNSRYLFFLYFSLKKVKDKIEILKDGHSAQPHVYAKDVNNILIPKLNEDEIDILETKLKIIFLEIFNNVKEIKELKILQNKLISLVSKVVK